MIAPREKPIARSVPISLDLEETAAYIVFAAPKPAPTARIVARNTPATWIGAAWRVCSA